MVIYPGTLSGGLTEDDMSQLKEVQGKGSGNLENDTEKRSEQRQLILRESAAEFRERLTKVCQSRSKRSLVKTRQR